MKITKISPTIAGSSFHYDNQLSVIPDFVGVRNSKFVSHRSSLVIRLFYCSFIRLFGCSIVLLFLLLSPLLWRGAGVRCQDIHFSQYYESPLSLNPALTGVFNGDIRAVINYRNQWRTISNPYQTFSLCFDGGLLKKKLQTGYLGVGLLLLNDRAGDTKLGSTQGSVSVSYIVSLSKKHFLSGGLQAGISQIGIDRNNLHWGNQYNLQGEYDANLPSGEVVSFDNFIHSNFSGGIDWSFYSKETTVSSNDGIKIDAGVALFHANAPKYSFYNYNNKKERLAPKYVLHSRTSFGIPQTNIAIIPSLMILRQTSLKEILFGSNIRYMLKEESKYTGFIKEIALSVGGHYRVGDAFILVGQFEFTNWALGISYDFNISGLKVATLGKGGGEITLRYVQPSPFRYKYERPVPSFY